MKATIKLFKALPIEARGLSFPSKRVLEKTIKLGFVFSPEVIYNYPYLDKLIKLVEEVYGVTAEKMNASFHKSWGKVKDTPMEQLIVEQLAHYLTTYGKEDPIGYALEKGITSIPKDFQLSRLYDRDYIYIPKEDLNIPNMDMEGIKLVVIKGYTKSELKTKLLDLLNSGIALREDTIEDVVNVALFVGITGKEVENMKNKEVRVILYDYLSFVPTNPTEFLRYVVYQSTDETLLIKSKALISKIKENAGFKIVKYFEAYETNYGLEKLAEIFYRFKPIFLAFRTNQEMKAIINKLRRLAKDYHKPMPEDYLNTITCKVKQAQLISVNKLNTELNKVNVFRKIRLAYALKFRTKDVDSILFRIRNGKAYATDFAFEEKEYAERILDVVLDSIVKDIKKNVKGKKIYIPDYINYALPATEKQFTGNFPSGTYIRIPQDMIFGIHWDNVGHSQIDLDLSLISPTTGKLGWDGGYRSENKDILYSGDITSAPKPKGATELFYVEKQLEDNFILFCNYYNYSESVKVPFKIIVAEEKDKNFGRDYVVNPNNLITAVQSEISCKQKVLGLLSTTTEESRFYFAELSIGKSITSSRMEYNEQARKYLIAFYQNSIELKDILVRAGADVWNEPSSLIDIDLSPENLEKDSILNLLIK